MASLLENPYHEDRKDRKPGVAGLVGDFFGEGAKKALEKELGSKEEKPTAEPLQENWTDMVISPAEKKAMQTEKEHIRLRDVPSFAKFPDAETLKKDYALDKVRIEECLKDRFVASSVLTDSLLGAIGVDASLSGRILEAMEMSKETPGLAKIFDIGDIIRQKQVADPDHPGMLQTTDVLEIIDAAGYRPATIQELLAYSRDYWEPDLDAGHPSDDEKRQRHHADAKGIFALGSVFHDSHVGNLLIPFLDWRNEERVLGGSVLMGAWIPGNYLLVVRKRPSSPSSS